MQKFIVTEEMKRIIEKQGYMVIQFKKWCYEIEPFLDRVMNGIIQVWQKLVYFFQYMAMKVKESMVHVLEKYGVYLEEESLSDVVCVKNAPKYPFVRSLGRKYQSNYINKQIHHRCRDCC